MSRFLTLCAAIFCLSLTAAAGDTAPALDASSSAPEVAAPEPAAPASLLPSDRYPWQLSMGYQYLHFNTPGNSFHVNGFNTSLTRFMNNWFGVETNATEGFGHAGGAANIVAKSFFGGGGPHVAIHNGSKLEPWGHALIGWQHFSTGAGINSALGFMVGGGADYKIRNRFFLRLQADYIGTRLQSTLQKNYSGGAGFVFNF